MQDNQSMMTIDRHIEQTTPCLIESKSVPLAGCLSPVTGPPPPPPPVRGNDQPQVDLHVMYSAFRAQQPATSTGIHFRMSTRQAIW